MKLSKKLLAGLLATSMLATGSTASAKVSYGTGLTPSAGDPEVYEGAGTSTSTADGDKAKHTVTGSVTFEDSVSVEITWGTLTYSCTRTWDADKKKWKEAVWTTTSGSGRISATNKSTESYDVKLSFDKTAFVSYDKGINYTGIQGKFYDTEVLSSGNDAGKTEQETLVLGGIKDSNRTETSYLWLSGNPENAEGVSTSGTSSSEVFGTVTATLKKHS